MKKKTDKTPLNKIPIVYFLLARLFRENFSRTSTIHAGIFLGQALWADCVPRQFKNHTELFLNV